LTTIPANELVNVIPGVISAGGTGLAITTMALTNGTRVPIGTVQSFPTAPAVGSYFGLTSAEYAFAQDYFGGYVNATQVPGSLSYTQYNPTAVSAYLRGGEISGLTLAQLQAISGSLDILIDGYAHNAASVNLSGATSFSNAATIIQTGINGSLPTEASFTASLGAAITASMGGHFGTCTTTGTTLTLGSVTDGYLSAGDLVSGTDSTNSLPAGCYVVKQLTGTPGGSVGATFQLSAAGTPGNLSSFTCTGTSTVVDATAVTGLISVGDTVTTVSASAVVASQLTGTPNGVGTYQLSGVTAQGIASESMTVKSTVLDVTVCASPTIAVGQTLVGASVTGSPLIAAQTGGSMGGVGTYSISGAQQHVVSESMTGVATAAVVTFDQISGSFLVTSGITGTPSTIALATGTAAAPLMLTAATGAILSQGAAPATPAAFMTELVGITLNWALFTTIFDPDGGSGNAQKQAFAAWKDTQDNRFGYVAEDADPLPATESPDASSLGYILDNNGDSGTCPCWEPSYGNAALAAFVCGAAASINFGQTNGRITFAYKAQAGFAAGVTTAAAAANLLANGYNFYGAYGAANQNYVWLQNGSCTGPFEWFDSYVNQIWLNAQLQSALLTLLGNAGSIPYSVAGNSLISQALQDPINAGLNFGAFAPGQISAAQAAEVNNAAGANIANALQTQGWYLQILQASSATRAARGSPPCTFFYLDRGSVQTISLASIEVQ
jgi:hypothetical protein